LDRQTALTAAAHALADGISSWRDGDVELDDLIEEAATPGGIAATVMSTMDQGKYQALVEKALRAGVARSRENARLAKATKTKATRRSQSKSTATNKPRA
jgi:pyrroline-5-carboxylate reductase